MLFLSSHWNLETVYIPNISRYIPLLCSPFSPSTFDCLPNSHSPSAKLAEPTPPSLTKGNLRGLSHLWGPYPLASHEGLGVAKCSGYWDMTLSLLKDLQGKFLHSHEENHEGKIVLYILLDVFMSAHNVWDCRSHIPTLRGLSL